VQAADRKSERGERLFISLDPPGEVRAALAVWGREAVSVIGSGRPVSRSSIHLTLAFLGYLAPKERDTVGPTLAEIDLPAARLRTSGPVWLPHRRPRALAVEVKDDLGSLLAIRAALLDILNSVIGWKPERSGFLPHMTAVRFGRGGGSSALELPPTPSIKFEAGDLVLYRSTLGQSGATYEAISRSRLGSH
jgi:2'-5' RNA ligase